MKKSILILAVSAALTSFAAVVRTTWVDFGTVGPDVYADGTAVEAGAEYRLLYLPADVSSLDDATLCKTAKAAALKSGGAHCPLTTFQYPFGDYAGGTFVTVLGDGSVQSVTVIASTSSAGGSARAGQALTAADTAPAALAADATPPRIESVAVKGDQVFLTVSGLCIGTYSIETGTLGGAWTATGYGFANRVAGAPSVTVVLPKPAGDAAFYRVTAK